MLPPWICRWNMYPAQSWVSVRVGGRVRGYLDRDYDVYGGAQVRWAQFDGANLGGGTGLLQTLIA